MDIECLLTRELLREIEIHVNEIEDISESSLYFISNKLKIVYKEHNIASLAILRFEDNNIALAELAYDYEYWDAFRELNLFSKLEKIINNKQDSILYFSEINMISGQAMIRIEYKTNGFSQYHNDMVDRLNSLLDTTPVLDGYLLTMANSGLVVVEPSILGESPLSVIITDKKINHIEKKALENILNRINQYCLLYSFKMVKSSKHNVINIVYTEEVEENIDIETVIDDFLNKPQAPGDE